MKRIESEFKVDISGISLSDHFDPEKTIFTDIETTGFSAKINVIYEIGCIVFKEGKPVIIQFFAERYSEEEDILREFFKLCEGKDTLVHFNGNTFDVPFMKTKAVHYKMDAPFDRMKGIDIFKRVAPFKDALMLPDCKLKTIERFLGVSREDEMTGGELIEIYKHYVKHPDEEAERLLILHNHDDMEGMIRILPILSYSDIFSDDLRVVKVFSTRLKESARGIDENDSVLSKVHMKIVFPVSLPKEMNINRYGIEFSASGNEGNLTVPLYECEMKYFYKDYKDYYYLPYEDVALHKSVAAFVDKDHRKQAKASNCYTRKEGAYLPAKAELFAPAFKRSYDDDVIFFEVTDEIKKDPKAFKQYALHLLKFIMSRNEKKANIEMA